MSMMPYKKRKIDKALVRPEAHYGDPPVTIDIADGPAIPRENDPGLFSAWWVVMVATPLIIYYLINYEYFARFFLERLPDFLWTFANWQAPSSNWIWKPVIWLAHLTGNIIEWVSKIAFSENNYRRCFSFMPDGFLVTFKITCFSIPVSVFLGIVTGLCRISRIRAINLASSIYVEVVRGIPLLVQIFYIYYALGRLLPIPPMVSAVLAMGFCYGAYMGEVVRSGIEAIDRGQREAAMSLGFTPFQTMVYVILPQAMRTILPPIGNECIALLKDSTLVSVMAIADIMRRAREFASSTYAYFEAYTMVALVYLFLTLLLSKMVSKMEQRMSSYERR